MAVRRQLIYPDRIPEVAGWVSLWIFSFVEIDNNCTFLYHSEGKVSLIKQHAYHYQLRGLMATAQVQWCDFVVFTNLWERTMVQLLTSFDYVLPYLKIC